MGTAVFTTQYPRFGTAERCGGKPVREEDKVRTLWRLLRPERASWAAALSEVGGEWRKRRRSSAADADADAE
jgi:hypothetical protein